jgi:RNA polymerase sporulation-specific sigma factor
MLSQEELLHYVRQAKLGDNTAKSIVFDNNTALIKSIIRRFKNKGIEYDDLYQIACVGFLKAINNFDESFGVKFSTYSVPMIIGEIKRFMRDNGAIKVSRALKILANKMTKYIDAYQLEHNDSPSIELLAKEFNVQPEEVVFALDSTKLPLSIYDNFEDDEEGQKLIDKIPATEDEDNMVDKIHLLNIIDGLNDREKKIIVLRYFRDRTQSEIAENLGVSQVQVSRLENKIIEKMRLKY